MLRKLSSLFCAAALSFALVGCGDSQVDSTTPPADEPEVSMPTADEPTADEPTADEPVADDPAADDTTEPAAEDEGTN